jgi:hypothetical protein
MRFAKRVQVVMTLGLICFGTGCCEPRGSSSLGPQIMRLNAGETHTATSAEVWHSAARYAALEQELINCAGALKQRDNK